ncbi:MAG: AAA family ATPase, partial [Gammaproteobacteria bacterium]
MNGSIETPEEAARRLAASAIRDGYVFEALHAYTYADGRPWYWRFRYRHPDTKDKWIRPMRSNGMGYELGEPGYPDGKPLYKLHEFAARPIPVIVCEGEWCADALACLGVLATTSGSADSAAKADWRPLAGRDVTIWPDHDQPGQRYAAEAAERLLALGCTVRVIDVDQLGLPRKGDAVDWIAANPNAAAADVAALPCVEAGRRDATEPRVLIVRGDTLKVKPIWWAWDGWLARGKLHVLAGAPGTGKSTISLALAAVVTTGGLWPDGSRCAPGHVLVWSDEDDPEDTLLPRFLASGGDPRRFHVVRGVADSNGPRQFDPSTDIPLLLAEAQHLPDCTLTIVDPVVSVVAGDSHKNTEVRRALQPLAGFAGAAGTAVFGISHFTKGTAGRDPVERVTGSVAFGALPRVVMAAARVQEGDTERRIFCRAKSNIGPDGGGWEYGLALTTVRGDDGITVATSCTQWGKALEGSARELLAEAEASSSSEAAEDRQEERNAVKAAEEW